jgi:photosystem II stability/assembly factor-like uncharacterized protein
MKPYSPRLFLIAIAVIDGIITSNAQWIPTSGLDGRAVSSFAVIDSNIFVGTNGGIFLSVDNGISWAAVNSGLTMTNVSSLVLTSAGLLAGTRGGGVFLSTNRGASWVPMNSGLTDMDVYTVGSSGLNTMFAGTNSSGLFRSTNRGASWSQSAFSDRKVYAIAVNGSNVYCAVQDIGVFHSRTRGSIWSLMGSGLTDKDISSLTVFGVNIIAGSVGNGIFMSTDDGATWTSQNTGMANARIQCFDASSTYGVMGGVNFFAGSSNAVYLSTDSSKTWNDVSAGLEGRDVRALVVLGDFLFAGTSMTGVWRRPLSEMITPELKWTLQAPSTQWPHLRAVFAIDVNTQIAVGDLGTIIRTTNAGETWIRQSSGTTVDLKCVWFTDAATGFAVGGKGTILRTTDGGVSWSARTIDTAITFYGIS